MTFDEARQILAAFEREEVGYVLIGSMAMAAQGLIRATRDVDFFVSPEPKNVDRLQRALRSVFNDDPNIDEITAADLGGDYPAIEYTPPHGRYFLDILTRLGDAWRFEDLESEVLVVDGVSIRVATPAQLYRMKKGTVRPQDRLDAEAIRERFGLDEEDQSGRSKVPFGSGHVRTPTAASPRPGEPAPRVWAHGSCPPLASESSPSGSAEVPLLR